MRINYSAIDYCSCSSGLLDTNSRTGNESPPGLPTPMHPPSSSSYHTLQHTTAESPSGFVDHMYSELGTISSVPHLEVRQNHENGAGGYSQIGPNTGGGHYEVESMIYTTPQFQVLGDLTTCILLGSAWLVHTHNTVAASVLSYVEKVYCNCVKCCSMRRCRQD